MKITPIVQNYYNQNNNSRNPNFKALTVKNVIKTLEVNPVADEFEDTICEGWARAVLHDNPIARLFEQIVKRENFDHNKSIGYKDGQFIGIIPTEDGSALESSIQKELGTNAEFIPLEEATVNSSRLIEELSMIC